MTAEEFADLLEGYADEVRRDYSGRGMFGAACVGFVCGQGEAHGIIADCIAAEEDAERREELAYIFGKARTDSMGRDIIVYFPGMKTS